MKGLSNPGPEPFSISVTPDRDQVFVAPVGEIDISTCGALRSRMTELDDEGFTRLVLDLRGVTFIDSSGLKLILDRMSQDSVQFGVIAGPDPVQRMFEILGITDAIPFVPPPASSARG